MSEDPTPSHLDPHADTSTPSKGPDAEDPLMRRKGSVSPQRDRTSHWRKGWRAGIRLCAIFTTCIFAFNMVISIYVLAKHGSGSAGNGTVVMYTGKCKTTKRFSLWLHFGINAVSTCLLGAGNYTMQVLNSPTREEINKRHACSRWVEIGVPSFRNLRWISKRRVVLWWLLALSSVPLHLLFNSVVFTSVGTNLYSGIVAPKAFLERSSYYITSCMYGCNYSQSDPIQNTDWKDRVEYIRTHASSFERLENAACIRKYGQSFISDYHDLILVTSNNSLTVSGRSGANPVVIPFDIYLNTNNARLYEWICGFVGKWCDTRQVAENVKSSGWEVNGQPIEYCLAEPWPEECTLSFNASIMLITLICNIIKVVCMYCTLLQFKESNRTQLLVTLGDAAESFLKYPDSTTAGLCIAPGKAFKDSKNWKNIRRPQKWAGCETRWFQAAPIWLWVCVTCVTLLGIIVTGLLLIFVRAQLYGAFDSSAPTLSQYWRFGIGSTDVLTLVDVDHIPHGTLPLIILANLPQAIYSLLYLSYNAALTRMFASREWSLYASKPKAGLRTSWAVGQQRSTYFLQLPLRYAIPFMTLSLVLHWMISQSLFYVAVRVLEHGVERPYTGGKDRGNQSFETLGYSPIAIIMSMITAAVMMVAVVGHAGRKYAPGMPFAAASSAAISAACHSEDGAEIYDKAVKWGVVGVREGVGHCTFGKGEVGELEKGEQYA